MSAPKGNQYAAKPESELASSHLHIRISPAAKARFVLATQARSKRLGLGAEDTKLAAWVLDVLNAAADAELGPRAK